MNYSSIDVVFRGNICTIQMNRKESGNAITSQLLNELYQVIETCEAEATVVVLKGLPEVFCVGADFKGISEKGESNSQNNSNPELMYSLWEKIADGPFVSIAYVRGRVNAGGMGFVSACDIVLADNTVVFSLSEMLFGLFPACVIPFLIRKIGKQKVHYMTLMTKPMTVQQLYSWGLVDEYGEDGETILRHHILRLKHLSKETIINYKNYMKQLSGYVEEDKMLATRVNREMFSEPKNIERISRFVNLGELS